MLRRCSREGKHVTVQWRASQRLRDDTRQNRAVETRVQATAADHEPSATALTNARLDERPQLSTSSLGMQLVQIAARVEAESSVTKVGHGLLGDPKRGSDGTVRSGFDLQGGRGSRPRPRLCLGRRRRCRLGLEVDGRNPIRTAPPGANTGELALEETTLLLVGRPRERTRAFGRVPRRHSCDCSATRACRCPPST